MEEVWVELGERRYPIHIGENLLIRAGEILKKNGKVMVVTNPTVGELYLDELTEGLTGEGFEVSSSVVPDGERYKTLEWANRLYDSLLDHRMERGSTVVALGGGVIGDLAGFVAATYKRGLPLVQAPTTLLAQVDSSIGGKVGVDHARGKNMIGTFYQPRCVLISLEVLDTLPQRELRAGLAEVIKYGVISDEDLFGYVEENLEALLGWEPQALRFVVKRSCQIKASVVAKDERETGLRAILNFGHTLGHGLEAATDYGLYRHGEAVAAGMVWATEIAVGLKLTPEKTLTRIATLIARAGLPTRSEDVSPEEIIKFLRQDKKVLNGRVRFVLPKRVGQVVVTDTVPEELIRDVLKEYLG
ncbi:MAG: 3-dehydroquinate synthase [bacterium]